jgi:cell wall-associated NlpC family hydrolase
MNKKQFAEKMIGVPWVNRKHSYNEVDCHGLVYLFYRDVLNIDIGLPPSYYDESKDTAYCHAEDMATGNWIEVLRPSSCCMLLTCYHGDVPKHVGVMLDTVNVLHAWGSIKEGGSVKITPLHVIKRMFGKVTFHVRKEQL